jgi:hypothetical protein
MKVLAQRDREGPRDPVPRVMVIKAGCADDLLVDPVHLVHRLARTRGTVVGRRRLADGLRAPRTAHARCDTQARTGGLVGCWERSEDNPCGRTSLKHKRMPGMCRMAGSIIIH